MVVYSHAQMDHVLHEGIEVFYIIILYFFYCFYKNQTYMKNLNNFCKLFQKINLSLKLDSLHFDKGFSAVFLYRIT